MTTPGDESRSEGTSVNNSKDPPLIDEISTHAIFKLDAGGYIDSWSVSAQSLYGHDTGRIVGEHISELFADEEGSYPDMNDFLNRAKTGPREIEHWNKRANGTVFWATLTLSPLREDDLRGYAVVSQDTTEKKQYERMLERQNDRLKEFTDIIAHDLRNPLNVIDGRLELYQKTEEAQHLEYIEETTARMERLVEDLLRVARQGDVVTNPEPTDLETVIERAWEGTGNRSEEASLTYQAVPSVGADNDRLTELFENLFRNTIEHGGSQVSVLVGPLDSGFYVEDDGPGIPDEYRDEVFDHGFTSTETGSGYGLSVVRTIINAHGWNVRATESETGGARFEITGVEFLE